MTDRDTFNRNLGDISPFFGRENLGKELEERAANTFAKLRPFVPKKDGRKICPEGCIVETCQSSNKASGTFRKKRKTKKIKKTRKIKKIKKLKKKRTRKRRKLP